MRKISSLVMMLVLCTTLALAQNRVVTGQVTDDKGEPVAFASIKVKNGKTGVAADANGNFRIEVKDGAVLVISAAGSTDQEITVSAGKATYSVTLIKSNTELSSVVVTALGIKKSVKAITYATQNVSVERLTQTRDADFTTGLAGKVSGLTVSGQAGSKLGSTGAVRIRGVGSLNSANAIYVVDGTIVTNPADINMDNVATISVLKGNAATNLYGSLAEGGVIMITSRKPQKSKKWQVDFNTTTTLDVVNILPDYQNEYVGGGVANWRTFAFNPAIHPAEWKALDGKKFHDYSDDASWGPKMDGTEYIPWYSWYGGHKYSYQTASASPQKDNIRNFYDNAVTLNNNIAIGRGFEKGSMRFSYTNLNRTGIIPESKLNKHFLSANFNYEVIKNLTLNINANYTTEDIRGDFNDGYSNNTSGSFNQWFHRNLNTDILKELKGAKAGPANTLISWNHANPNANAAPSANFYKGNYWYNHYSYLELFQSEQNRQRLLGDVSLSYKIMKGLTASATYRLNYRPIEGFFKIPTAVRNGASQSGILDGYGTNESKFTEQTAEANIGYITNINDFSVDVMVGTQNIWRKTTDSSRSTNGGLVTPDIFTLANSTGLVNRGGNFGTYRATYGLFARGTFGWKDVLFADFSVRQEWNSRLPLQENGFNYPSYGVSFVFSEYLKKVLPTLTFGKLRASRSSVGSVPDAFLGEYALTPTYGTGNVSYNNNFFIGFPNTITDPTIKPAINISTEIGTDLRFFRDRLGLSFTYYTDERKNDIVPTSVSAPSGITSSILNAGLVTRQGFEVELNIKPIVTKNFTWDATLNWSSVDAKVEKVSDQSDILVRAGDAFGQIQLVHIKGEKPFQIVGNGIKRINGQPVIGADGTYETVANQNFGSTIADYFGGFFNNFNYKNWTLTAAFDFSQGGKFYSLSDNWGTYSGLLAKTAAINDNGKNVRDPVADGGGVHVFGVNESGKPYDVYVDGFTYYHQFYDRTPEEFIHDKSYIKFREASLGYRFNTKNWGTLGKAIKTMSFSLVARNLFIWTKVKGFDPSELAAEWGENGQLPGTRSYGATLRLGF